jgi:hypothetical protein
MTATRRIVNLIYRLFLFSWILAVLWVKGYLWSLFGLTVFLVLLDLFFTAQFYVSEARESASEKTRAKPRAARPKKVDGGGDSSWREPSPQWAQPPAKKG